MASSRVAGPIDATTNGREEEEEEEEEEEFITHGKIN